MTEPSAQTQCVVEIATTSALIHIATNLAMQLALMDGGSFTTVRAVLAACDQHVRPPRLPPVVPAAAKNYDAAAALEILDAKLRDLPQIVAERAATGLLRNGVKIRR
jgi:hypothetical protein